MAQTSVPPLAIQELLRLVLDEPSAALQVSIVSGGAGGAGGTQYTEDAAAAGNPVGTALMLVREDARAGSLVSADGDNVAARGNNKGELYVIDTDALAQLVLAVASLSAMDDWDESDRAKVNLIAGQAGIAGGTGVDGSNVPRVTLATNVALPAGTNAIGKLAANSGVDIGDVDILSIAAGDNNIGNVDVVTQPARVATTDTITAKLATDAIQNGTTALTPKFAVIDNATSGDNTIVSAVASKKIRVLSLFLVAAGAVNVRFESGAGGTALTGQMNLAANGGFVLPFNPVGWFETASNTLLNLELSGAVSVDGSLTYVEV